MSELIVREARAEEMDNIYRLRYKVFCEELKFLNPDDHPDLMEKDQYDQNSYHIIITREEKIVGYVRLILPHEKIKFPIEEAVSLPDLFDRIRTVEVSRGIVVPGERGKGVKEALIKAVFDYCQNNNFPCFLSFSNKTMFDNWRKAGIKFLYSGECVQYHGFDTWPLIIPVR